MLGSGSNGLLGWLVLTSLIFIVIMGLFTWALGISSHDNFGDLLWDFTMRIVIPWEIESNMGTPPYLLILFILTIFGIFILSILISFISAIIDARIRNFSAGAGPFPFKDHIVILGYSSRVVDIIKELVEANESEATCRILIASKIDHSALSEEIAKHIKNTKTTHVFWRSRRLESFDTFDNLNLINARKVVVLGDENETKHLDRLKICIALRNYILASADPQKKFLAEASDENEATWIKSATDGLAMPVVLAKLPGRLIFETVFQPNLPSTYEEILSFGGNELYITQSIRDLGTTDITFREICKRFNSSIPVGLIGPDNTPVINPPPNRRLAPSDKIVLLSEDDAKIHMRQDDIVEEQHSRATGTIKFEEKLDGDKTFNVVLAGHSGLSLEIAKNLTKQSNCKITFISNNVHPDEIETAKLIQDAGGTVIYGPSYEMNHLQQSGALVADSVIVANEAPASLDSSDLTVIKTLLAIKENKIGETTPHIIAELRSSDSRDLLAELFDSDFIVSSKISSKVFAQFIENPELTSVIDELICSGSHPISFNAFRIGEQSEGLKFSDLRDAAADAHKIVLGLRVFDGKKISTLLNPGDNYDLCRNTDRIEAILLG